MPTVGPKEVSPFTPGSPVPVELFAGRAQQIQEVDNYLKQTASGSQENVFLTGDRGIGKSSFASIVRQLAGLNHDMVGIHVFLGGVTTLEELVRRILEELVKVGWDKPWSNRISDILGDHVRQVGLFGIKIEFQPEQDDLSQIARRFPEALGEFVARITEDKRGVFIILDDINGLAENDLFANWYKSVVDQIATQFGPYPALVMLSGLPERLDQLSVQQPSLMRVFRIVELERLSDEEVEDFFSKAFGEVGMAVNSDAMRLMLEYSSGLPVMMQEIGDATFWADSDGEVTRRDAESGISGAAINVGRKYLDPSIYRAIRSDRYRAIIRKMSSDSIQPTFTRQQIASRVSEEEFRVFDNLLRRLRELGVVETDPEGGRGAYKYTNQIYPVYMWMESQSYVSVKASLFQAVP